MGPELIKNGTFNGNFAGWLWPNSKALLTPTNSVVLTTTGTYGGMISDLLVIGIDKTYVASLSYKASSAGWKFKIAEKAAVFAANVPGSVDVSLGIIGKTTIETYRFKAGKQGIFHWILYNANANAVIEVDDISFREEIVSNATEIQSNEIIAPPPPGTVPAPPPAQVGGSPVVVNPVPVPTPAVTGTSSPADPASAAARSVGQAAIDLENSIITASSGAGSPAVQTYWYASQSTWMKIILVGIVLYFIKKRFF